MDMKNGQQYHENVLAADKRKPSHTDTMTVGPRDEQWTSVTSYDFLALAQGLGGGLFFAYRSCG